MDAWDAWEPATVAARLEGVDLPWYVAGGWAIDLFLGTVTREHDDLEIAVPEPDFPAIASRFPDLEFYVAGGGQVVPVTPESLAEHHQTWALDPAASAWRFDVFREPTSGPDTWISRRDERLRLPYTELIRHSPDGIPYLTPEVNLLFKAKHSRPKDQADFTRVAPLLTPPQREWLDAALALVHPGHEWSHALT